MLIIASAGKTFLVEISGDLDGVTASICDIYNTCASILTAVWN